MKDILSAIGAVLIAFFFMRTWLDTGFTVIGGLWFAVIGSISFSLYLAARRHWTYWKPVAATFLLAGVVGGLTILCSVPQTPPLP